jgi:hypothetical protein
MKARGARVGLALWLCLWGWSASASAQSQHLPDVASLRALCERSSPLPPEEGAESPPRAWLKGRQGQLARSFSVDVEARRFRFAEEPQLLTVVDQESWPLVDGSYALALRERPLLGFEVAEEEAQRIRIGCGAETVVLRLHFVLDPQEALERPWCEARRDGAVWVRGRLWRAQLLRASEASQPGESVELARLESPEGRGFAAALGLLGGPAPSVRAQKVSLVEGAQDPALLERLGRDAELVVWPCYLASLSRGGPESAALSMELRFGAQGEVKDAFATVDATGSEALVQCSARALRLLRAPELSAAGALRLTLYFERR